LRFPAWCSSTSVEGISAGRFAISEPFRVKGTHFGYGVLSSSILDVYRLSAQGYALWAPLLCKGCERIPCGLGGEYVVSVAKASAHRVGYVPGSGWSDGDSVLWRDEERHSLLTQ